jgi:hypothetical protein
MPEPLNLAPDSGLVEVSLDEVDKMLQTPGVQVVVPNESGGTTVYEVQDYVPLNQVKADDAEEDQ